MRWVLGIEYNGSAYHGWQKQSALGLNTIQQHVETAVSSIADHPIEVVCAGRTDTGVHALGQVIHFDALAQRRSIAWVAGGNQLLPPDIRVLWAKTVDETFHARYSAISRRYCYVIYHAPVRPAILHQQVTWHYGALDIEKMQIAANFLLGEHDFSAFRGSDCQAKTAIRRVEHMDIKREGCFIVIDIKANAFLHHMVRNIAGVLMDVGIGKHPPGWAKQVLEGRDRKLGGMTAKPHGLYLSQIQYPLEYDLPFAEDLKLISLLYQ